MAIYKFSNISNSENKELKEHVEIFKDIMKEKSAMLLLNDVEVYNLLQRNDIQGLTSLVLGQGRKPITLRIKSNTDYIRWSHSLLEVIVGMNSNKNKTKDVITKECNHRRMVTNASS